jgi:predicted nucleic acid-binding protein
VKSSFKRILLAYKKIGIDSMCFIYHFEVNKSYGEIVKKLFLQLQKDKLTAVTSTITLAEILSFEKLQKDRILFEQTKTRLRQTPNLEIIPVDETIGEIAAIIKYKYSIALPDAIQIATAVVSGQEAFITNDRRLQKIKEIKVLILDDFR